MAMTEVPVDEINLADPEPFQQGRAHAIFTRLRRERRSTAWADDDRNGEAAARPPARHR
jgi:hypothetical protein